MRDFPYFYCGEPLRIAVRYGWIINEEASGYTAYGAVPFWKWFEDIGSA